MKTNPYLLLVLLVTAITATPVFAAESEPPSDSVIREWIPTYYKAKTDSFKRGKPFTTEEGIPAGTTDSKKGIPKGTLVYPIRIEFEGSKTHSDLFFFKDEFNEWLCMRRSDQKLFQK
jgi:hypothetical protein